MERKSAPAAYALKAWSRVRRMCSSIGGTPEAQKVLDFLAKEFPKAFDKVRFGKLLFLARDLCRGQFSVDRKRNENGFAVFSRHTFSAEGDVLDF